MYLNAFGELQLTGTCTNDEWQENALLLSLSPELYPQEHPPP